MDSFRFFLIAAFALLASGCGDQGTPKPRGFPRIALPEQEYRLFDQGYPFRMEYPVYAEFVPDERATAEPYWGDIWYPGFNGRIHLSYKEINSPEQLRDYLEDTRNFVHRHIPKATAITEELFRYEGNNVSGKIYHIRGREAASPLQFFATDSLSHFLRGALYFDARPNNDSLAPVIRFIEKDIRNLLGTLEWE